MAMSRKTAAREHANDEMDSVQHASGLRAVLTRRAVEEDEADDRAGVELQQVFKRVTEQPEERQQHREEREHGEGSGGAVEG